MIRFGRSRNNATNSMPPPYLHNMFIDQPMMMDNEYSYPENMPMAMKLMNEALKGETEDKMFYNYLISVAPTQEDKDIIAEIRNDEMMHYDLFKQMHHELTSQMQEEVQNEEFVKPESYCKGVKDAMMGELRAVEKYRKILFAMQDRRHINMMTRIITDELRHANLYNHLYTKNECFRDRKKDEK